MVEYSLLVVVLGLGITVGILLLGKRPELINKAFTVAMFGVLLSAFAWSCKQAISSISNRTALIILEKLSDGRKMTLTEIKAMFKSGGSLYWRFLHTLFPSITTDTLATLVMEKKQLQIVDGKYEMCKA